MGEIIEVKGVRVPIGTHKGKRIVIGADHNGYELKKGICKVLKEQGYEVKDIGTYSPERCDFPDISGKIGRKISDDHYNIVGIGICGSGAGIIMTAHKYKRVFAAEFSTPKKAAKGRKHLNFNLLGIGAEDVSLEEAIKIVEAFLTTPFYGDPSKDGVYLRRYIKNVKEEDRRLNEELEAML